MDTSLNPPVADLELLRKRALMAGVAGLVLCAIGFVVNRDHFFRSWLVAFLLFLGIALGSMTLAMITPPIREWTSEAVALRASIVALDA